MAAATVRTPDHRIDITTLAKLAAPTLTLNDIGIADIQTDRPIVFEPYATGPELGGFILFDRTTNAT
jgi:bifunctional enzyme CysN/CysC